MNQPDANHSDPSAGTAAGLGVAESRAVGRHATTRRSALALLGAGVAAGLASGCCVVPLLLVLLGVSGAWMRYLRVFAPFSVPLLGLAFTLLSVAGWMVFRSTAAQPGTPAVTCVAPAAVCDTGVPALRRWFWLVLLLALIPLVVPWLAPWFY